MKMKSRLLSMMTAAMMTVSMLPANALQLTASASSGKSTTNLTIDFGYEARNGVTTPEDTLLKLGAESLTYDDKMSKTE